MSTDPTGYQPTLAGLTLPSPQTEAVTPLQTAALATIEALDSLKVLEPRHAVAVQLVLELSAVIGRAVAKGQAAAAAMASQRLLDALATLPEPAAPQAEDPMARLMAEFERAAREGQPS